jgi:AcrR family transcriptional regulator
MSTKASQKRQHILTCAYQVFAQKGFRAVTMQDIVAACGISRGGLYLHFNSIEEIFAAVLQMEEERGEGEILLEDASAADILALFMKEQKKEILRKSHSLTVAIYEYYFALNSQQKKLAHKQNILEQQFHKGVLILEKLLSDGVAAGEFACDDPLGYATNLMYTLEGLKITARTVGLSETEIDQQLIYMMQGLVIEP